ALGRQFDRNLNHHEQRTASAHLKFDERNEQVTHGCRLLSLRHLRGLIEVRMLAKFLLGQLNDVGVPTGKLPALKRVVQKIHSDNFCGNENRLGMFATANDARSRKEPGRVNTVPRFSGRCVVRLDKRVNRSVREMNADAERWFRIVVLRGSCHTSLVLVCSQGRSNRVSFSKREAVTTQTEKSRVTVARRLDPSKELMRGVNATVLTALGARLMLHRHTDSRGFTNVQWCAVAAKNHNG